MTPVGGTPEKDRLRRLRPPCNHPIWHAVPLCMHVGIIPQKPRTRMKTRMRTTLIPFLREVAVTVLLRSPILRWPFQGGYYSVVFPPWTSRTSEISRWSCSQSKRLSRAPCYSTPTRTRWSIRTWRRSGAAARRICLAYVNWLWCTSCCACWEGPTRGWRSVQRAERVLYWKRVHSLWHIPYENFPTWNFNNKTWFT